ncbi:MAG: hypothetical protein KJ734_10330, partial [Chloroflexi bacterium]|nr:hypothetical protein [Chloroflexota bacterium]
LGQAGLQPNPLPPFPIREGGTAAPPLVGEGPGEGLVWAILGIGVNVNADEATMRAIAPQASSLLAEQGTPVSRVRLLRAILEGLEARYERLLAGEAEPLRREWAARLETLGQPVTVTTPGRVLGGIAEDVDEDGALLLRLPDGRLERLLAGDVTLRL